MGIEFHFGMIEKVLEMDGGDGSTASWRHLMPLKCLFKILCYVYFATVKD